MMDSSDNTKTLNKVNKRVVGIHISTITEFYNSGHVIGISSTYNTDRYKRINGN